MYNLVCSSLPVVLIVLLSGRLPDMVAVYLLFLWADAVLNRIIGLLPAHNNLEIQIHM